MAFNVSSSLYTATTTQLVLDKWCVGVFVPARVVAKSGQAMMVERDKERGGQGDGDDNDSYSSLVTGH